MCVVHQEQTLRNAAWMKTLPDIRDVVYKYEKSIANALINNYKLKSIHGVVALLPSRFKEPADLSQDRT